MDHGAGDGIRGRLADWMQRRELTYRLLGFRLFATFGYTVIIAQTAQKRGVLIGLVALVALVPFLLTMWRQGPGYARYPAWMLRNKAASTIHVTIFSFATACLIFPWSTETCGLVTVTMIGMFSILDLAGRRRRSTQAH